MLDEPTSGNEGNSNPDYSSYLCGRDEYLRERSFRRWVSNIMISAGKRGQELDLLLNLIMRFFCLLSDLEIIMACRFEELAGTTKLRHWTVLEDLQTRKLDPPWFDTGQPKFLRENLLISSLSWNYLAIFGQICDYWWEMDCLMVVLRDADNILVVKSRFKHSPLPHQISMRGSHLLWVATI